MHDFTRLKVWQKSRELVLEVYRNSAGFPRDEQYALASQVKRACTSIAANIAEGCGRGSDQDMARFLQIAAGSACELESHLLIARDLGFLDASKCQSLLSAVGEVKLMLAALMSKLRKGKIPRTGES